MSAGLCRHHQNGKLRAAEKLPPPVELMKANMNPDDTKLSALLREARVSPALPPRFQENVWQRIEDAEAPPPSKPDLSWLDALAALVLRPRFALVTAAALVVAGALLGVREGNLAVKQAAQLQYLTEVAPAALR